jgi:sortase A
LDAKGEGHRHVHRGAGLIAGTAGLDDSGNVGIAGHRDGYFRALEGVVVGDLITVETLAGMRDYLAAR